MALTAINEIMNDMKVGKCSQQLYAQFFFRIKMLKEAFGNYICIGCFTPSLYISSETFSGLRKIMMPANIEDSFLLQANQFANVSGGWGIAFSLID
ncbi:MAG: hypothetical protein ACOCM4_14720, partial [Acetivibrio ethanolgignens]